MVAIPFIIWIIIGEDSLNYFAGNYLEHPCLLQVLCSVLYLGYFYICLSGLLLDLPQVEAYVVKKSSLEHTVLSKRKVIF